jgi:hypothetical protein
MFEFTQKYLDAGFSIIPLRFNSKQPALDSWGEFQTRRPTPEEVQKWWGDGHQHGVAIVCGKVSGIVVLDIDDPEKFGVALKAIGETLPDTPIVRTRKGWHLYFRYPANRTVRRHDRLDDWGAELRGDGCYVVAPPTVIDGYRYHWAKRNGRLMALGEVPIAECPEWLLDAFGVPFADDQNKPVPVQIAPQTQPTNSSGNTLSPEQKRALKSILVPNWVEGHRHELALGLAGLLAKSGITQDDALSLLREIAAEANDNEWNDRERALQDSFTKLWRGEQVIGYRRLEEIIGEQAAKVIAAIVSPRKADNGRQPIGLLTLSEWDERLAHISQGQWLVEGLLQASWLLVINARPKVGKSIVSVNLATALAEGTLFLNLPTSPCAVVYVDLERPIETLNRFKALNAVSNPNIFVPDERVGADALDALRSLIKQARERTGRPVVVFVDTLGDFVKPALRQRKASINDYDAIAEILQELRNLALEFGCAFIFVHHARKALSEELTEVDVLGSTAIAGKFDVIAHLQPDRTDGSVLVLTAEGNAIAKTTLHFTISDNYRLEVCEPPAKTKEEQAAREIRRLLKQHPEGLTRNEIVGYLQGIGLVDTVEGAQKLFSRAIQMLRLQVRREGRRTRYLLPQDEDDGGSDGHNGNDVRRADEACRADNGQVGQDREFVQNVQHAQKAQQNKAKNNGHDYGHGDGTMSNVAGETLDTMDTMDKIPLSKMSIVSNVGGIVGANYGQPPEPMSNVVSIKKTQAGLAFSPIMDTMDKLYIASDVSNVGDIVEPSVTEPLPPTIAELDATEPTSEPKNSETNLSQSEKFVDTEKWLDELCAELSKASSKPDDNASLSSQQKPDRLACLCGGELRLFGKTYECLRCDSPRIAACRYCGKVLQLTSDSHAECVGCGLPYTFDRARRLWLSDFDAF